MMSIRHKFKKKKKKLVADHDGIQLAFCSHSAFSNHLKQVHLSKQINRLVNLKLQGQVFQTICDHALLSKYLCNFSLSDDLVRFIIKSRLQLLECNSLLHRYCPTSNTYHKTCRICNNPSDHIVSHRMNSSTSCIEMIGIGI